MKNTLLYFFTIVFLLTGIHSFAKDNLTCPTATISYSSNMFCTSSNLQNVMLTGTDAYLGGVFTAMPAGLNINPTTGAFNPTASAPGVYTITYTIAAGSGCPSFETTTTITISAQLYAGTDGSITVCENSTVTIDLFSLITGEHAGGTWVRTSGFGGTFNAGAGTFTPSFGATTSTFEYILTGSAPCVNDSSVATVFIIPQPNSGIDGETWVSESSTTSINLFNLIIGEQAGGAWTRTGGTGGTFNAVAGTFIPAIGCTTSTFTYTLVGSAPCVNDVSLATVNIDVVPVGVPSANNQTITNGGFSNITLSSSNVPGASFTWTYTANNISGASNGSGTIISQQLSLTNPNLDGYVDFTITPINNTATGNSFTARVGIQAVLNADTFIANNVKLSPNPVTDILNIENEYQINSIKIYNQLGQLVFGETINKYSTQLDLSEINTGIYNVIIETEKGTMNNKIIKK